MQITEKLRKRYSRLPSLGLSRFGNRAATTHANAP